MDNERLSGHPEHMEFLSNCLGDNLQPHPGPSLMVACSHPDPPKPGGDQTWALDSPDFTWPDPPMDSSAEPMQQLGSDSSPGDTKQNQSSSTQVVFWAGILQAQMCVLDLEEELEKTEDLRTELRCCLPTSPTNFPTYSSTLEGPQDSDLHPRPPVEEGLGEDSSRPEEENQITEWRKEGTPGSTPEWGPEEESVFFDNPLFLESPSSDTSAPGTCFSWGFTESFSDVKTGSENPQRMESEIPQRTGPESPQVLEPPLSGDAALWELGSKSNGEGGTAESSGHTTPPFLMPTYRLHSFSWVALDTSEESLKELPDLGEKKTSLGDNLNPAPSAASCEDQALTQKTGDFGCHPNPATHSVQHWAFLSPESRLTEESPSWHQVPLHSHDQGDRDAKRPQESVSYTLAPGPWGSPASSPEPTSPESKSRSPGPRPSPVTNQEGSLQLQSQDSDHVFPERTLDASCLSLLGTDGTEPRFQEKEEAGEVPNPGKDINSEAPAGIAATAAVLSDIHVTSVEELAESPMPQALPPEGGQRPQTRDKLANGVKNDKVAWNLASRLYHLEGFRKSEVAAYLRKNNEFSRAVAEEYLSFFQFGGQSLDRALRGFLQALVLSGETQERERILYQFSRRFYHCNPGLFSSVDCVHTLTCAIMLLNTDLHGQNIGKSMSCQEFINNLNGLRDGGNFPKELLKALYWSIRSEKLEWAVDENVAAKPEKTRLSPLASKMSSPFLQLAQDPVVPIYKQGILARKMHHDADGKKTPWGKRGWKMFHTMLRGMVLYFLKGEDHNPEGESLVGQMVDEPVGVHHSLASPATHYTKKPHVFQLRTADWRLYLFQAPTAKEMTSWIARINLAAATHSAPPFPAAVGSQRRFVRPILPMGLTQSSLEEQHQSHENCLDAASDDLLDLQRNLPERRGRSRELEEYRLRKEYLEYEKTRYEMYVQLLVTRLHCPSDDLDLWEEQLGREAEGPRESKPSLKKSHSSPSLQQDEAPTTAKVKRNISERRTYRKIIPKRNRNQL
ncbi:PH and SEC7 domain-containing protein 4 [Erinaceus europaeus]|uniref:PH and SEC7 domain-containing protein 4 n=1 Tax=Erinaceus europaeus TaxID=9365 RepID=A0ABM3X354_ERIEU|nr:PH and SEC7 domain-containing protein 4 [Erinaceus europaeus]XP_060043250.1 PH and SEC7 domain-containing protein 4 [Erinaceus europaeus]XP_060043251.1 PH and SEC7 domain-containing protein 4 [Erinaceus europaeus]XP_060043252.1 PH and SEC7 domain-containing protein 4 [Erinaceus europaeus]